MDGLGYVTLSFIVSEQHVSVDFIRSLLITISVITSQDFGLEQVIIHKIAKKVGSTEESGSTESHWS